MAEKRRETPNPGVMRKETELLLQQIDEVLDECESENVPEARGAGGEDLPEVSGGVARRKR